jgi:predicted component of type VI protein secretion system
MYLGLEFACELQLTLAKDDVPDLSLDGAGRLGLNSWLKTRPLAQDADDARFALV